MTDGGTDVNEIATYLRIQQFLFHEARLMDEHRYDDWLALWEEDGHYWIPCNQDEVDRRVHISLVNENYAGLQDRVMRLKGPANYAQQPPSRTTHVVSNIELSPSDTPGEIVVDSIVSVTATRRGRTDTATGRVRHHLRDGPDGPRISAKKVTLIDNDDVFGNLTFLI